MTDTATIIGGARAAGALVDRLSHEVQAFTRVSGLPPALALVAIDDDPAQRLYVRKKVVQCERAGIRPVLRPVPRGATTDDVAEIVRTLNEDPSVHGIFVQWPLPAAVQLDAVAFAIAASKDIDGMAHTDFTPAAVLASRKLLQLARSDVAGLTATVASESQVFAKPMARLLLDAGCAVTLLNRNNNEFASVCRRSDVLVTALGVAEFVRGEWVKPGATIIDASVNVSRESDGAPRYVGDVQFAEAVRVAGAITPVPGGVGPMTIACLLENTLQAAQRHIRRKG